MDGEWTEGVLAYVVEDGVGGAVSLQGGVIGVLAALAAWEGDVGGPKVGAVEHDYLVVVEELHVHGGDADGGLQESPLALVAGICLR